MKANKCNLNIIFHLQPVHRVWMLKTNNLLFNFINARSSDLLSYKCLKYLRDDTDREQLLEVTKTRSMPARYLFLN